MKIGILCYPTFGGSGVVATELGKELAGKGHEIHFITYKQPARLSFLSKNIFFHKVNVPEYPLFLYNPYELALATTVYNVVKKHKLDLVHVHYAIPHAFASLMAKNMLLELGLKIPIVTTLHGTDITLVGKHPSYKDAVNYSINSSDAVTAVSESLKQETLKTFDIDKKIEVIYNFINQEEADKEKDCVRGMLAEENEKIVTHISNFRKVKRTEDVIKVFDGIQKEIKAKLLLVGEGPELIKVKELASKLGLNNIIYLGNSSEIDRILCHSDLFLLPSEKESFGLVALEAMSHRTPVISTNTGGLPELNQHGFSGFLSDIGDIDDMIKNSLYILSDEERLLKFKLNAKEISSRFSNKKMVKEYENLYETLV